MINNIDSSWNNIFNDICKKEYFKKLNNFLKKEYSQYTVYPSENNIFNAFKLCSFDGLKVVILGQDPYHNENQANGLCFSVNYGVRIPKSLRNIFLEIKNNFGYVDEKNGDLSRWAKQGVLLLNTTLTVRRNEPGSHFGNGWDFFSNDIIKYINDRKKHVVYMLWGEKAKSKMSLINCKDNLVLTSAHPSPFSAHRGFWGNKHFFKANEYLSSNNLETIKWF